MVHLASAKTPPSDLGLLCALGNREEMALYFRVSRIGNISGLRR
jgi:hypothetical protein